jgi:hypothetical protein
MATICSTCQTLTSFYNCLYDAINIVSTDTVENVFAAVNHIFYVNFVFIQATNFSLITVTSLEFLHFNGCCNQEMGLLIIYEILIVSFSLSLKNKIFPRKLYILFCITCVFNAFVLQDLLDQKFFETYGIRYL